MLVAAVNTNLPENFGNILERGPFQITYGDDCEVRENDSYLAVFEGDIFEGKGLPMGPDDMERWLNSLAGRFAIILVNKENGTTTVATDWFCNRPLYHTQVKEGILIATSPYLLGAPLETDSDAIEQFIVFNFVRPPRTLFTGIESIPHASMLTIDKNGSTKHLKKYWNTFQSLEQDVPEKPEEYLRNEILKTLITATKDHGRPAVSLSGGVDSGGILGMLAKETAKQVHAYTITKDAQVRDDALYARISAEYAGVPWHPIVFSKERLNDLPSMLKGIAQPVFPFALLTTNEVLERARNDGSEIVCFGFGTDWVTGDMFYTPILRRMKYLRIIPRSIRHGICNILAKLIPSHRHKFEFVLRHETLIHKYARLKYPFFDQARHLYRDGIEKHRDVVIEQLLSIFSTDKSYQDQMIELDYEFHLYHRLLSLTELSPGRDGRFFAPFYTRKPFEAMLLQGQDRQRERYNKQVLRDAFLPYTDSRIQNRPQGGNVIKLKKMHDESFRRQCLRYINGHRILQGVLRKPVDMETLMRIPGWTMWLLDTLSLCIWYDVNVEGKAQRHLDAFIANPE